MRDVVNMAVLLILGLGSGAYLLLSGPYETASGEVIAWQERKAGMVADATFVQVRFQDATGQSYVFETSYNARRTGRTFSPYEGLRLDVIYPRDQPEKAKLERDHFGRAAAWFYLVVDLGAAAFLLWRRRRRAA